MRSWIGPVALLLVSCGSSTTTTETATGTAIREEDPSYVDFAPQASTDGQRQVFLTKRDAGAFRVYLYNEAADPKLSALTNSIPIEGAADELATSLSDDGNWILTWRYGTEKNDLLLNSFDATQQQTWSQDADSRLRDLSLAPSGQHYFAYTNRQNGVDSVHIFSFTPGSLSTAVEEAVISGEYEAQFAVSGSDLYVFTRKVSDAGQIAIQYRKRSVSGSWDLESGSLSLSRSDITTSSVGTAKGLFYAKTLDTMRLKTKLGSYEGTSESFQKNVGVIQEALQFQAFSTSALDFSAVDYRKNQPLTLGNISATADGSYILLTGYEAWFCKGRTASHNLMMLVRTSDGATLPLIPNRATDTLPWTGLVSEPCSYYDQETIDAVKDFDASVANGQILSVTNNHVTLIYESKNTGDREIRRLTFDVTDWAAKTYANPLFTDISANTR